MRNGDKIFIGGKSQIVEIRGEVNSPGFYQFHKGYRYNDYVKLAGGYTTNASKFASYVVGPDGRSTKIKIHKPSPKIFDGSIINVGKKEEYVPFNFTEYVTNLTTIYADITQAYLMILIASGKIKAFVKMTFEDLKKAMKDNFGIVRLADIAREFNVSPQVINNWKTRDQIPYKYIKKYNELIVEKNQLLQKDNKYVWPNPFLSSERSNDEDDISITEYFFRF